MFRISRSTHLKFGLLLLMLFMMTFSHHLVAQPGQHGAAIQVSCMSPVRVCDSDADCSDGDACTTEGCDETLPNTISCQILVSHADTNGDSLRVDDAHVVVQTGSGDVILPSPGELQVSAVSGNTDCVVGSFVPCQIGSDLGGGEGAVQFFVEGYNPTFTDSSPLVSQAWASFTDLCDGFDPTNCNSNPGNTLSAATATALVESCDSSPIACDDGNLCTDDSCDPVTGCIYTPNIGCDDGDACTDDVCDPATGACEYTPNIDCDDGDACTDDVCDPVTGLCESTPNVDCDDADLCTNDFCDPLTGLCDSTPNIVCDDGESCTDDACDPGTGTCFFTGNGSCNVTPAGMGVPVMPIVVDDDNNSVPNAPDVAVTFEDVQAAGETTVVATEYAEGATPPPSGFKISGLSGGPIIYDIESTATLAAGSTFEICFDYSSLPITGDPADLVLVHEVAGVWVDITSSNDTVGMILCGTTDSFSFFAIFEAFAVVGPPDPVVSTGTEVFLGVDVSGVPVANTVRWSWGDGTHTDIVITSTEVVTGHIYAEPGVYMVTAQLLEMSGGSEVETGSAVFQFVVVYDPTSGFVTGGGWIDSPEGAYVADTTLTGKAHFGFVSKYKKGAQLPSGNTEFKFQAGDLHFRSSDYDWLVISGARAQLKGTGTINGTGNLGFMLKAVDAALTPNTVADLFRIKIWDMDDGDTIVYDNELGITEDDDPTTAIGGGAIVIHKAKKK